jgi:uncharacterized pyridoxamine 5'-phosphate oxidase family protein
MTEMFADLEKDFLRIMSEVVLCTVTTVSESGKPRSRMLHPLWEVVDGKPIGWVFTMPSPVKAKHLAGNPNVAISCMSPTGQLVLAQAVANWVEDLPSKKHVYDLFNNTPPPAGVDLSLFLIDGPEHPNFHVLRLDPTMVQVNTEFPQTFTPRMARL